MGIFSSKRTKNFVVVDIGGNSVTAGFVADPTSKTCPQIIASASAPLEYGSPVSMIHYQRSLTKGLQTALTVVHRQTSSVPDQFVCLLPSLLFHNTILTLQYDEPKGFTVTPKLLTNIIEKNIHDWLRNDMFTNGNYRLLESVILSTRINGYPIDTPHNKQGTRLELSIYASVAEDRILDSLEAVFRNYTHGRPVIYRTSTVVHYQVVSNLLPHQSNYLFIDATGELCDLLYISDGILRGHISFPVGSSTLLRHLVDSTGTVKSEAGSTLALYVANSLPTLTTSKITKSLEGLRTIWQTQMEAALREATNYGPLPQQVFILDDDPGARLYAKWINETGFEDLRLGGGKISASLLGKAQLQDLCPTPGGLEYHVGLVLGSLFARNLGE